MRPKNWTLTDRTVSPGNPPPVRLADKFDAFEKPATSSWPGDRQHEEQLIRIGSPSGVEGFIERGTGRADLPVDSRTACAIMLSQRTDRLGARECLQCDGFAFVVRQSGSGRAGDLTHGCGTMKIGAPLSPRAPCATQCVTQL
jgi:hypothetical protein